MAIGTILSSIAGQGFVGGLVKNITGTVGGIFNKKYDTKQNVAQINAQSEIEIEDKEQKGKNRRTLYIVLGAGISIFTTMYFLFKIKYINLQNK